MKVNVDRESTRTWTMVACYQYASAASTAVIQIVWLLLLVLGLLCPANAMMQIKLKPTGSGAAATGLGEHGLLQSESKIKLYRWSEEVYMQNQA